MVGVIETRIMESVGLSRTVSHDIRTRFASLASLGTFVTNRVFREDSVKSTLRKDSLKSIPCLLVGSL